MFLRNRRALVTGAAGGIGSAIALALAAEGMHLALLDRGTLTPAAEACTGAGAVTVTTHEVDLADVAQATRAFAGLAATGVDVLVNAAGIQRTAPLGQMTRATWDAILAVNLSAAFDSMTAVLPGMAERGYGRVINIASVHGLVASVEKAAYVSAKHGLIGLTRVAALEYAQVGSAATGGVTVNALCPGWVHTPLIDSQIDALAAAHGGDREAGRLALVQEKVPSLRMTDPADIAAFVVFLCQRQAHNITGAALTADGGWTAR